jgi:hypothetical protein
VEAVQDLSKIFQMLIFQGLQMGIFFNITHRKINGKQLPIVVEVDQLALGALGR